MKMRGLFYDPIWVYTKGPPKDFGLQSMDFSKMSYKKRDIMVIKEPWPNAFGVNMSLVSIIIRGISSKSNA